MTSQDPTVENSSKASAIALSKQAVLDKKRTVGFMPQSQRAHSIASSVNFAQVLASAYLKFTQSVLEQDQPDTAQAFIELHRIHHRLTEQIETFLKKRLPVIREDEPVQDILFQFAQWRLDEAEALQESVNTLQAELERVRALTVIGV